MSEADYHLRRAEAELELAQSATHPAAVRAHYLLAGYYLDNVYGEQIEKAPSPLQLAFGLASEAEAA